ncbi:MAG: serine/threonine-protein phosphatase [Polyangiaceae bacterium]|nr:serine/threonine-protein phosphatase [Polyangiaceae bacterium]
MRRSARGLVIEFAELSDPGLDPTKQVNEDSCAYEETAHGHLALVCDGMGGHKGGRLASETAVATILDGMRRAPVGTSAADLLRSTIGQACQAVHEVGGSGPVETRPGTTCVATLLYDGKAEVAHVGDSRLYLIRGGEIRRVTRDHSLVQQMLDAGLLTEAQAAVHPDVNRITRALGMFPDVDVEVRPKPLLLAPGDLLLLSSDGLTDMLEDEALLTIVRETFESGPEVTCQRLVDAANARGGHDNITVQVLLVVEAPRRVAEPTLVEPTLVDGPVPNVTATLPPAADVSARPLEPTRSDEALKGLPKAAATPTLVDEPPAQEGRLTEPWMAPVPGADARIPLDPQGSAAAAGQAHKGAGRLLVGAAALVAIGIVAGIALWWLLGAQPDKQQNGQPNSYPDAGQRFYDAGAGPAKIPHPTPDGLDPFQSHPHRGGFHRPAEGRPPRRDLPLEIAPEPVDDAGTPPP